MGLGLAAPARASDGEALEAMLALAERGGVQLLERPQCGAPGQLATYNMGTNQLCLNAGLKRDRVQRAVVVQHELVHVVQDCLDGLETPTSQSLAVGLRSSGALDGAQLNAFFLSYLRDQGNLNHVVAATAPLPLDSRQREIEAYALQRDPALVARLLRLSCQLQRP